MHQVKQELLSALAAELEKLTPGAGAKAAFESPKVAAHGDLATTAAMQLAKPLKKNPRELATALVAALVAGCDNKPATAPMPEVNDENCKPENIAKIEDKGVQQAFSSRCLRRGGEFKPSPKREW